MRWLLYNFVFLIGSIILLPHFWLKMLRRGGYRRNFKNRFGKYDAETLAKIHRGAILIHAVSVGEVGVACQFIREFQKYEPKRKFVLSTTSSTGHQEAERRLPKDIPIIYNPIDFSIFDKRMLDTIKPSAYIMVETEIWPNLILECERRKIPMAIINGRLSDKTAPAYRRFRMWFGPALSAIKVIQVQSKLDEERYIAAGANPRSISVTGSFKFDVAKRNEEKEAMVKKLYSDFGLNGREILLGASTWDGEEKLLITMLKKLQKSHPDLRLVLIPRHQERASAIVREVETQGLRPLLKTDIDSGKVPPKQLTSQDILIANTTGEMMGFYPFATVAFVGRTFYSKGGQNMIEPCLCGIPTIVGPHTENFRPVMFDLLENEALIQVGNEELFYEKLLSLFNDNEKRNELGIRARKAVLSRLGAVQNSVLLLRIALEDI